MAGRALFKIVYTQVCRILGLVVALFRGDRARAAERLVLRHENAVLRRLWGARGLPGLRPARCAGVSRRHDDLCVPRISSSALTSRVALLAVRPC